MNKFLLRFLFFFISFLLLNSIIYFVVYKKYFNSYGSSETNYNTYILGDSHVIHLGRLLEKNNIFNFSEGGDSYEDMLIKLNYLIANTSVKTVLIEADDHTLSSFKDHSNNLDRSVIYSTKNDYSSSFDFFKYSYLYRYLPVLNPKTLLLLRSWLYSFKANSSSQLSVEWLNNKDKTMLANETANRCFDGVFSVKQEKALIDMINKCKLNHIKIIGIKYPLTKEYYTIIKDKAFNADSVFLKNNLQVIDFTKAFINNDSLFINPDHLNAEGGKRLADSLKVKLFN